MNKVNNMTNIDALDLAVVELAKDTERLYHDKPELFAPQVNELRRLGVVEESAITFIMGFYAGTALMVDCLERDKEEEQRRAMFTVMEGGRV